jgi:hypothetical protein
VESTWLRKAHSNVSAVIPLDTRSVTLDTDPSSSHVGVPPLRWMPYPAGTTSVLCLWGKPHNKLPGCIEWKEKKKHPFRHVCPIFDILRTQRLIREVTRELRFEADPSNAID